jgi:hypothetical protein
VMSVLYVIYVRYVAMSVAADHSTPERKQSSEDFAFSRVISGFATVRSGPGSIGHGFLLLTRMRWTVDTGRHAACGRGGCGRACFIDCTLFYFLFYIYNI